MTDAIETFVELGRGVHYWQGDLAAHEQTNMGVVVHADAVVVIDANFPWAAERVLAAIVARWGLPVRHVVNTHHHVDHSLGNGVFVAAGATVIGAVGQRRELRDKGPDDAVVQIGAVPERFDPPSIEFEGVLRFFEPDLHLIAVGRAHSEADVVAWLPEDRVLFVGDLAVAWDAGNNFSDPDADIDRWIGVLDDLIGLEPAVVVPAHGRLSTAADLIAQRDFIRDVWAAALAVRTSEEADDLRDGGTAERLRARHPEYATDRTGFAEMAGSLLDAARTRGSRVSDDPRAIPR